MERLFTDFSARKLRQHEERIQDCLDRLTEEQIWMRDSETQNAAGNLVLHLCGNVRQWIIAHVGGQPDTRRRDSEFAARGDMTAAELKERLHTTISVAAAVIETLPPERLRERVTIQGYDVTVLEAIYHVVEHFAGHAGQIIFLTKWYTRDDLGFHAHLQRERAHSETTP